MEEYKLINYSDIFLSYFHQVGRECTFRVKNHTLFYVCSGEMEINERGTVTKFHRGECAFIRRDNRVTLNKRCIRGRKAFYFYYVDLFPEISVGILSVDE